MMILLIASGQGTTQHGGALWFVGVPSDVASSVAGLQVKGYVEHRMVSPGGRVV
jgi:hypothetical protein